MKKAPVETIKSKSGGKDVLTEMFEHFGVKVIDVSDGYPRPRPKKELDETKERRSGSLSKIRPLPGT